MLSKTQIDKVGDKLRRDEADEDALTKLFQYQEEFVPAYKYVERILTKKMYLTITGRPAKSTLSIIEKLRRINSRLSQVQDVSGCRTIVHNLAAQDEAIQRAKDWFVSLQVDDKRDNPTHGYRAVHLLVMHEGKCVEVQIRTRIQHFWATISEKLSDTYGQEIKYGKGNQKVLSLLDRLSHNTRHFDLLVNRLHEMQHDHVLALSQNRRDQVRTLNKRIKDQEQQLRHTMYEARAILLKFDQMEDRNVLSD
ncbi:hypothetical protein [Novilysobacter spongiicola]|uniref:RelA/SpoT domain-containing protein n=1 Tax=Lysobacter spongiicola DSM 21749 TaxID=1122188 RepID=A0A1T4R6P2_9GAMM|nr:hypothetical protein [Lysobacter spongiicola]SKA11714.1 hypothetical protein SAMN02745674_02001 [Lysobacter spongiicola DSM 21749]